MSLKTFSSFYYGYQVTSENQFLSFSEGGGELTATITVGDYSLTTLLTEIETSLNSAGALTYTVTVDRSTRIITIAATGTFSLLPVTGSTSGTSIFGLIGFTTDRSGSATYAGDIASGFIYEPQFKLQNYTSSDDFQESIRPTVNESADGTLEVVSFGVRKFIEMNIDYINNIYQPVSGPIISNLTGIEDAQAFMQNAVKKVKMEFMEDKDSPSTFETVILERTPENGKGTSYRLKEDFSRKPNYFSTGLIRWRVV